MTADVTARLAEIQERSRPGLALALGGLIGEATTTHAYEGPVPDHAADGPFIAQGCVVTPVAALKDAVSGIWFRDMPGLLSFAQQALGLADRLAADAARLRNFKDNERVDLVVERGERSADLQHAADEIRALLAAALSAPAKEPIRHA